MRYKMIKKIYIGTLGTSSNKLKDSIKEFLIDNYTVIDVNENLENDLHAGREVSTQVLSNKDSIGIVFCGNGFGISKDASIHDDITVINCVTVSQAMSGRINNDANILALGSRMVSDQVAKDIVNAFLNTNR